MNLISSLSRRRSSVDLTSTPTTTAAAAAPRSPSAKSRWNLFSSGSPRFNEVPEVDLLRRELLELRKKTSSQAAELHALKSSLQREEIESAEWQEKWNFQNFKLQLLIDMWVLREIELECAQEGKPLDLGEDSILEKTKSLREPLFSPPKEGEVMRGELLEVQPKREAGLGWQKGDVTTPIEMLEEKPRASAAEGVNDLEVESSIDDEF
ncbi:hypothetical protein BSKO_11248 [Bryopsis sp. KO-2023]|nr:hypothetical protein BSKO_11248 [Bryopsis sp. KO-2023]